MKIEVETVNDYIRVMPASSRREQVSWVLWIMKDGSGAVHFDQYSTEGKRRTESIDLPPNKKRKKIG